MLELSFSVEAKNLTETRSKIVNEKFLFLQTSTECEIFAYHHKLCWCISSVSCLTIRFFVCGSAECKFYLFYTLPQPFGKFACGNRLQVKKTAKI